MSKANLLLGSLLLSVLVASLFLGGCGGDSAVALYFSVSEGASWSSLGRLAFASYGGDGQLYVASVTSTGGGAVFLTPTAGQGGRHPAYSPDGLNVAFASQRGDSPAIYIMDATTGDRAGADKITDDTGTGVDMQPSWRPDGLALIYTSTRRNNNSDIRTIDTDGTNQQALLADGREYQWPGYNPDATEIVVQRADSRGDDDTDIYVYDLADINNPTAIAPSPFTDGAPAWSPDGEKIAFHSDRYGSFEILLWNITTQTLIRVTNDDLGNRWPVWNADSDQIAFTHSAQPFLPGELWSAVAEEDGALTQITRILR